MKNRKFDIEIPSPCARAWDEMDAERGANGAARFCNQCQEDVYDISSMTRREAQAFMEKHRWQVCVNYEVDEEGKIIYAPEPPSRWARQLEGALRLAAAAALVVPLASACDEAPEQVEPTASAPIEISSEGAKLEVKEVDPGAGRSPSFPTKGKEVEESEEKVACDGIDHPDNVQPKDTTEEKKVTDKVIEEKKAHPRPYKKRLGGKPIAPRGKVFASDE